ncbi:potassium channel family protein [Corynebacterium sp. 20_84]
MNITPVMVIGLGRFGVSLASELTANGVEVLGIDVDPKLVKEHASQLTDAVVADATDPEALEQLGLADIKHVVLAVGTNLESSILTASNLIEAGVPDVWAKADSESHGRILKQLGVHHVVHPERDTGRRVAHLLGGQFREFAEIAPGYSVTSMSAPQALVGVPVDLDALWRQEGTQVIAVRGIDGDFHPLKPGTVLEPSDVIIAGGSPAALEHLTR